MSISWFFGEGKYSHGAVGNFYATPSGNKPRQRAAFSPRFQMRTTISPGDRYRATYGQNSKTE